MKNIAIPARAAILARCSTEANVCSQVITLQQYARDKYLVEPDDIYGDHINGSSAIAERPELNRLMKNVEEGTKKYAVVLVEDATRLGKSAEQVHELVEWFISRNITVQFYKQPMDVVL